MKSLLLFSLVPAALGVVLPNLTGRLPVGVVEFELVNDTVVPERDIMVSVFYPTKQNNYPLALDFPPAVGIYVDSSLGLANGTVDGVRTRSTKGSPIDTSHGDFPLVLFDTGLSVPREIYTSIAENIASNGYIVVSVDHPFDAIVIEYPNGTVAYAHYQQNSTVATEHTALRARDLLFIVDQLAESPTKIPGLHRINTSHVGIVGHSIGGAAAATAMLLDERIACGIDMDGSLWGPVISQGLDGPFMIMTSATHNRSTDDTLEDFWSNLRGFRRELSIDATEHMSYSDLVVLVQDYAALIDEDDRISLIGTINGTRMLDIVSAYVDSFLGKFLKGEEGKLLEGNSTAFPEVHFDD